MYQGKMAYEQWEAELYSKGTNLKKAVDDAYTLYKKFYDLTYGKTAAQILAMDQFSSSGLTEAGITDLQNAMNCLSDFYKAMNNQTVSQVDRFGYLYKFL